MSQQTDALERRTDRKTVGYWYSPREPDLPFPEVGEPLPDKENVVKYLREMHHCLAQRGSSHCRLCSLRTNGSMNVRDDVYVWPEGLAHYVEEHNVVLPDEFIEHIRTQFSKLFD